MILSENVINIFATRVEDMELSPRGRNALRNDSIYYAGQVAQFTPPQLLRVPNFGRSSLVEVEAFFQKHDLQLGMLEYEERLEFAPSLPRKLPAQDKSGSTLDDSFLKNKDERLFLELLRGRFSQEAYDRREAQKRSYSHADLVSQRRAQILSDWLLQNLPESIKARGLSGEFVGAVVTDKAVLEKVEAVLTAAVAEKLLREGGPS